MAWSDWKKVVDEAPLPEGLGPCSKWQYKWDIHHEFDIAPYLGANGGSITMQFRVQWGPHTLLDTAKFSFMTITDPLDPGFGASQYKYWLGSGTTVREAGTATQGGDEIGQVVFAEAGSTWAFGVSEGFFWGELLGDVWDGEIAADEIVDITKYYPNLYIPKGRQLWVRTLAGAEPMQQTVLDPSTHNKHEFWLDGKTLLHRLQRSLDGKHSGLTMGGAVTAGALGSVSVAAGYAMLEQVEAGFSAGSAVIGGGGRVMLVEIFGVKTLLVQAAEPYMYPHAVLGRVTAGGVITQTADVKGTVIADGVEEFSAWIEDDGKLKVNVGKASVRRQFVSKDRGSSWTATA